MKFELFLTLENMHWYGYIPCPKDGDLSGVEVYQLEDSDWPLLEANFLEPVDALCDALLDYGDIDFFDVDKCKKLSVWLEDQLAGNGATGRLRVLYEKLHEYTRRAIELGKRARGVLRPAVASDGLWYRRPSDRRSATSGEVTFYRAAQPHGWVAHRDACPLPRARHVGLNAALNRLRVMPLLARGSRENFFCIISYYRAL